MLSYLFPLFYGVVVIALLWQAFRVMGKGFIGDKSQRPVGAKSKNFVVSFLVQDLELDF